MDYRTRILPPAEWPRLAGTEAETIWPMLNPATAQVLVVEREQAILGCWILAPVLHAECLWIAPECRKTGGVARRLWAAMRRAVLASDSRTVATTAVSDDVRALLAHIGATQLPGDHFVMHFQEPKTCQP